MCSVAGPGKRDALSNSAFSATCERKTGIMRVRTLQESLSSCDVSNLCVDLKRSNSLDKHRSSSVRFSEVRIREHAVTVGDNPSCSSGAPISLDWMHNPLELNVEVDTYEEAREPRRSQVALRIPSGVRYNLLIDKWELSMFDVMIAQEETSKLREQRMNTTKKVQRAMIREESLVALKKSLKKCFTINRRSRGRQEKDIMLLGKKHRGVTSPVSSDGSDDSYSSSDEEL